MGATDQVKRLVLFDGVCNLCNGSVQFIIKRDKHARFQFASLQSDEGQAQLKQLQIPTTSFESIVLIKNGKVFQRSDAALEIARELDGAWKVFYGFKIIPRFLRDFIYNWIARNRYRFFGRQDECMIPTPDLRARFLG